MRNARQRLLALGAFTVMIFALWASVARADCNPVTPTASVTGFFDGNVAAG